MEDNLLQSALEALTDALLPILLSALGALMLQGWRLLSAELKRRNLQFVEDVLRQLVIAAEQKQIDAILLTGEEKLEWVLGRAQIVLAGYNIHIDAARLTEIIKMHVLKEFNWKHVFTQPEPQILPKFDRRAQG